MHNTYLTTKYRPQTFKDVSGQYYIKQILSNASQQNKIAPAYLFSGSHGTGKTTIARIFAKTINCANAPTNEPCNSCSFCQQILNGISVDVQEIDAASNRGIDQIRNLKEELNYSNLQCRYRVIILDEAHMLTKEAFNALLKTLEEPLGQVVFILATTEPHKLPQTILSRCEHYIFKQLNHSEITDHLKFILISEDIQSTDEAIEIITTRANGSLRDAISLLAQLIAIDTKKLEIGNIKNFLSIVSIDEIFQLFNYIITKNLSELHTAIGKFLNEGIDLNYFLQMLSEFFRNLFIFKKLGKEASKIIIINEKNLQNYLEYSEQISLQHIHSAWQLILQGHNITKSINPAIALELLLINLTYLDELLPIKEINSNFEKKFTESVKQNTITEKELNNKTNEKNKKNNENISTKNWNGFIQYYRNRIIKDNITLIGISAVTIQQNDNKITIFCDASIQYQDLTSPTKFEYLKKILSEFFEIDIELAIELINNKKDSKRIKNVFTHKEPILEDLQKFLNATPININKNV